MITALKTIAPIILYLISCIMIFAALTGKTEWVIYFITALVPLRNVIERLQNYPLGNDLLDIMIILALVSVFIRVSSKKDEKFQFTSIHWIALVIMIYSMIAVINGSFYLGKPMIFSFSDKYVQSWKNFCVMPIMFFVTFATVKDKKMIWKIVTVMCLSMFLMDYYTGQQVMWYREIESRTKITGTFVYLGPNEVAAFYNQYTILLMGIYFFMKAGIKKLCLLGLILMNLFIVIFLFSRAAYAGLFIGMLFLFSFKKRFLLIPLILSAVYWQATLPEKVVERIEMTTGEYNELDKSSENRLIAWQDSIDLFEENPVFGVGYGVFQRSDFRLNDTHNVYLKILAEQGLIGLLLLLILLFSFFRNGLRLYRIADDDLSKGLGIGFASAIIVLFINNIFGDRWTHMEIGYYMWIFAALVCKLQFLILENQSNGPARKRKPRINRMDYGHLNT